MAGSRLPYNAFVFLLFLLVLLVFSGCTYSHKAISLPDLPSASISPVEQIDQDLLQTPDLILLGARKEIKNGTIYDSSYYAIGYPGGDVPIDRGACTDILIRSFRNADLDLQQLVHEDMNTHFPMYPNNWGLNQPDPNIDHRRVPNLMTFFDRHALSLPKSVTGHEDEWQWGDVVFWVFDDGQEHCGIISDRLNSRGYPLVIHNARIATEEDCLTRWRITGHYRYPP